MEAVTLAKSEVLSFCAHWLERSRLASEPWKVTINDLVTVRDSGTTGGQSKEALARTLMAYARANPHKIRGRLTPVIVYDPQAGRQAFSVTLRKLKE